MTPAELDALVQDSKEQRELIEETPRSLTLKMSIVSSILLFDNSVLLLTFRVFWECLNHPQ